MTEPTHPRPLDPAELGFETIVYEKAPPRATIRLNRPDVLNAFDFQMLREIARACEDASWDDEVRAVVVTGTGRAFCVGADLRSWGEDLLGNSSEYWKWFGAFKDMHDRLREIGKPTIARVNGIAVGGGNELQMACDLSVMVDTAFIRHVGLQHGSVPAGGATQWLQLMVGDRRAREIVFLCDEIPAAQAEEWGLVNRAVARGRARRGRRRVGREARGEAPADDALREAAAQRVARPRVASDRRPRPRLARDVDARRGGAGRGPCVPRPRQEGRHDVTEVLASRDGAVLTITLNRPDVYNAINRALHEGLAAALAEASDPAIRAVVLTGAGRGFCSGQDLREFESFPGGVRDALEQTYHPNVRAIRALEKPVIGAINGPVAGAGLSLACACDVRIGSANATFVPGFIGIGLVPDAGSTWFIHRLLGFTRAFEWMVSNRRLSADEALDWGLVSEVVPAEGFETRVQELAEWYAALPTRAVAMTKQLFEHAYTASLDRQLQLEAELQQAATQTEDFAEGVQAFLDKRPADFKGR